jgi:putative endonuclease
VAAWRLRLAGWRILEQRARTGAGEIDLVAARGRVLAFIEVKERASLATALEAVSPRQRGRLLRAGALWRGRHTRFEAYEVRFDLVLVAPWRWPRKIEGAFSAEDGSGHDLI